MTSSIHPNAEEVRLSLPWPPSANNLFLNIPGRGRIRSSTYRKWAGEAGWQLQIQRPKKFDGPVAVSIELCAPDKRRRDGDNLQKAILDLLVKHQVIVADDNRFVKETKARWVESGDPCVVTVRAA